MTPDNRPPRKRRRRRGGRPQGVELEAGNKLFRNLPGRSFERPRELQGDVRRHVAVVGVRRLLEFGLEAFGNVAQGLEDFLYLLREVIAHRLILKREAGCRPDRRHGGSWTAGPAKQTPAPAGGQA